MALRPSGLYSLFLGLVISGGQDTIIEVREPDSDPGKDPQYLLLGHTHNVCALDTFNSVIVSGSWDGYVGLFLHIQSMANGLTGLLGCGRTGTRYTCWKAMRELSGVF